MGIVPLDKGNYEMFKTWDFLIFISQLPDDS